MNKKTNNGIFYVVISLVAIIAIGSVAFAFKGNANRVIENVEIYNEAEQTTMGVDDGRLGGASGPDKYVKQFFHDSYQAGGDRYATSSTAATYTLTRTDGFDGEHYYIDWTPNVNTTLTTQATSSMYWLGNSVGSRETLLLRNASSTAGATITLAAGTGVDLQGNEDSADLAINGLDMARLEFIRKNNSDVILIIDEYTEAD